MYLLSLEIKNLRTLESARIRFNVPDSEKAAEPPPLPNVSLLLGDNGSGKTSVLRAAALAALGPVLASGSGFVPYSLVRRVRDRKMKMPSARITAELRLHPQDGETGTKTTTTELEPTSGWVDRFEPGKRPRWAEPMWDEKSPAFLMVGYGAGRRVDANGGFSEELRTKSRALRYSRVAGLFEEAVTMVPLSAWMPHFGDPLRRSRVVELINRLLAPQAKLLPEPVDGEYLYCIGSGAALPFQALSDGYRAYIGWIADLVYHLCMGTPNGEDLAQSRGVVLVDEVDLHLHPEWQQRMIPTVAQALPNLQFVFTSHSPLLVGSLHRGNVFVLETETKDGIEKTVLRPSTEEVYGLSADQILTSGHFGLASARDPQFTKRLQAQAHAAGEGGPEATLQFMRLMALGAGAGDSPSSSSPRKNDQD